MLFQEVSGENVILDLASESYFGLDVIGTREWSLLEAGACVAAMLDVLMDGVRSGKGGVGKRCGGVDGEFAGGSHYVCELNT